MAEGDGGPAAGWKARRNGEQRAEVRSQKSEVRSQRAAPSRAERVKRWEKPRLFHFQPRLRFRLPIRVIRVIRGPIFRKSRLATFFLTTDYTDFTNGSF